MTAREGQQRLTVISLPLKRATVEVQRLHRHHGKTAGHKWSHGVVREDGTLCGVAIVGRPVARCFDDGATLEVTRVATDGTPNACSKLYAAAWDKAKVDHWRLITYTQEGESGASLRAVGWKRLAELRPRTGWDTPTRRREDRGTDRVARTLWEQRRKDAPPPPALEALRDEMRDETCCAVCPQPIPLRDGPGRPARYCSRACQQRAYRLRAAA